MPIPLAVPLVISGISALASLFGGKKKQETTQNYNNTTNTNQSQNYSNLSMPTYDGYEGQIKNYLLGNFINRAQQDEDVTPWYQQGIKSINSGANMRSRLLSSNLAARGLSSSPMAAYAQRADDSQRIGDIVNLENQMPILKRQLQQESLQNLANFWGKLPVGQTSSGFASSQGTSTSSGTSTGTGTTSSGSPVGDAIGSFGAGLAGSIGFQDWLKKILGAGSSGAAQV